TIHSIRPLVKGRLIVVFGCGGDRDRGKRPMMGRIAELGSDIPILTSDNPRTEDPEKIIMDVLEGIENRGSVEYHIDRTKAIHTALDIAEENDCVLILGKGHETYQVLGTEKIYYDDREAARVFLNNKFSN
ncbi:MAG: UDP-N-acetylmuramoyl-L-alanyl-D-glutamate--2,6-diaminopimelate ligase, partial [bacterium]|nr:UDP-N-acetylmuramoyl-L-alanyl-D-glutamate--2,6-diaminopimelate ligase [bacterium]